MQIFAWIERNFLLPNHVIKKSGCENMYILLLVMIVLLVLSFYFTLTFMECLKEENKRKMIQSKRAAIIFLSLALGLLLILIPMLS